LPKKLILGWVGDSKVALHKREKTTAEHWLTEPKHTPDSKDEQVRIFNNRGETRPSNFD
jgi:serine/threonine protein phosphatase PrpC